MKIEMMKCGCSAMAIHKNKHDGLSEEHPSCFIHECCEIIEPPKLESRKARCFYYGKESYKSECSNCKKICNCERDSKIDLAFFKHIPESEYDEFYCGCHSWD